MWRKIALEKVQQKKYLNFSINSRVYTKGLILVEENLLLSNLGSPFKLIILGKEGPKISISRSPTFSWLFVISFKANAKLTVKEFYFIK